MSTYIDNSKYPNEESLIMRKTRKKLKIGRGTLRRAMLRRERLEDPTKNEL